MENQQSDAQQLAAANEPTFNDGAIAERQRMAGIQKLAREFEQLDFATRFIDNGTSVTDFEIELMRHVCAENKSKLEKMQKDNVNVKAAQSSPNNIGLTDKEARQFSIVNAIRALANPNNKRAVNDAAFEMEASEAQKERSGINDDSFMIPSDVLKRDFTTVEGAATIDTDLRVNDYVSLLKNKTVMIKNSRVLSGLRGKIAIPVQTDGSNVYWVGEGEDVGKGAFNTDTITMDSKRLGAYLPLTQELLINSSMDVENMVRNDLLSAIGLGIDTAALYGTGSDNQPLGLTKATGVSVINYAEWAPMYGDYIQMETMLATQNADVNSMRYILHPQQRGNAKYIPKFSNGETPIWESGSSINGYQTDVTNQLNFDEVIFGDFSQLLIGLWDGLRLTIDPYTKAKAGIIEVIAMQNVDVAVRRPDSFCLAKKAA